MARPSRRSPALLSIAALGILALPAGLDAKAAYIRGVTPPWGSVSNEAAMDAVFGAGQWADLRLDGGAAPFAVGTGDDYTFIFLEGSDQSALELAGFIGAHQAAIQTWVEHGGRLLVNAAPNVGGSFAMGFDVTLDYGPGRTFTATGFAADPNHVVFREPQALGTTSFTGNSFGHALVFGPGLNAILLSQETSAIVLGEKLVAAGVVLFGGMTTANFHGPQPQAEQLRANIIHYAVNRPAAAGPVAPSALATAQTTGLSVRLNWRDNSQDESAFVVERRGAAGGFFRVVATLEANATSHNDGGLCPETGYEYRVGARNASGAVRYALPVRATTRSSAGNSTVEVALAQFKKGQWNLVVKKAVFLPDAPIVDFDEGQFWIDVSGTTEDRFFEVGAARHGAVRMTPKRGKDGTLLKLTASDDEKNKVSLDLRKGVLKLTLLGVPDPDTVEGFRQLQLTLHLMEYSSRLVISGSPHPKKLNLIRMPPATAPIDVRPGVCAVE
jgi:hypothetical protein